LLFETAAGYALFEKDEFDEVAGELESVQSAISNFEKFATLVKLKAYQPFKTADEALSNINAVKDGEVTETLSEFLTAYLPKVKSKKKQKFMLGVSETKCGPQVTEKTGYTCSINPAITEMIRGIRTHFSKFSKKLDAKTLKQAQLGLAHSFSRVKVSHDVNREDKPIIQAIAIIEQMDKNINLFAMRLKEWFGYHFPELARIVTDNTTYCRIVHLVENKDNISSEMLEQLEEICVDEDKAKEIVEAAKTSMGHDLNEGDVAQIKTFSSRLNEQIEYRAQLGSYLEARLGNVSPNLQALVGDNVAAKLISQAGSLVNLAKAAASTI